MLDHEKLNPFDNPDVKVPLDDNWAAKRKLAEATRRLTENLVICTTDTAGLEQLTEQITAAADALEQAPQLFGRSAFEAVSDNSDYGHLGHELNPMDGHSNPVAPPINIWIEGERAYGLATMGWQYEGPPKSVHGGFIAALFDQFLGMAQRMTGQPGFTGTLTVKYLKPTPLATELRFEGWVDRIEGRKNFLKAELRVGDTLHAVCEGIFISVSAERQQAMMQADIAK